MKILRYFRLFSECYKVAGGVGLLACAKYLCGVLKLDDFPAESSDFPVGAVYD